VINLEKVDIQKYSYLNILKSIVLAMMNLFTRLESYFQSKNDNPPCNEILSWVLQSLISQINEVMAYDDEYARIKEIYKELNDTIRYINESGERVNITNLIEKVRGISVKVMTGLAKISEKFGM